MMIEQILKNLGRFRIDLISQLNLRCQRVIQYSDNFWEFTIKHTPLGTDSNKSLNNAPQSSPTFHITINFLREETDNAYADAIILIRFARPRTPIEMNTYLPPGCRTVYRSATERSSCAFVCISAKIHNNIRTQRSSKIDSMGMFKSRISFRWMICVQYFNTKSSWLSTKKGHYSDSRKIVWQFLLSKLVAKYLCRCQ